MSPWNPKPPSSDPNKGRASGRLPLLPCLRLGCVPPSATYPLGPGSNNSCSSEVPSGLAEERPVTVRTNTGPWHSRLRRHRQSCLQVRHGPVRRDAAERPRRRLPPPTPRAPLPGAPARQLGGWDSRAGHTGSGRPHPRQKAVRLATCAAAGGEAQAGAPAALFRTGNPARSKL